MKVDQTCRSTAHLEAKAERNKRMPLKRGVHKGAQCLDSRDLRHTVKAGLLEPQSPAMQVPILRSQRLSRSHQDIPTRVSSGPTLFLVGGEECPHSRGRTRYLRDARERSFTGKHGIAYGARALWRRSSRSSPRTGKPSTWRRGAGVSMPEQGGTRDADCRNCVGHHSRKG